MDNSTGIVRRITKAGRITIPSEIRDLLDIYEGDELEIIVNGDEIHLVRVNSD
jgi:AbrB family looped-hinge helix DNA binding protein